MMAMRRYLSVLGATLVICGCADAGRPASPPLDRLECEVVTREQTIDGCVAGTDECAYVRPEYPVFVGAPEGYAVTAVADAVLSLLDPEQHLGESARDVEALMGALLDGHRDYEPQPTDGGQPWFLERQVSVVHNTPEIVSLRLVWRAFAGGAHGMTETAFRSLDPRSGAGIGLTDVLVDGFEETLLPLVEARFREVHALEEGAALADAGFVFDDDTFALPENVRIDGVGLTFYCNLYEVAPYAFGPTEIALTYDELGGLLREGIREAVDADTGPGEPH